ncbi:unnamed protein product [Thlaspi arvense]|uniref:Peptidase A1 domain-containing protein n=1 Tax=Thlaspi arvense TaxID=13288 RepID=A0AAU9SYG2_THLAR|nr:unnamed protein product [Thlaspi arvense]
MSIMRNLLNIIVIILCGCLYSCCTEGARQTKSGEVCSHTIQVSSLFPSSSPCLVSSKAPNTKSSLRVVHRHSTCSHLSSGRATTNPDHDEILRLDQARVDSINYKISKDRVRPMKSTDVPAKNWGSGPGTYIVTIGIGTPKHDLSLLFDTGSDLTWTQCQPCVGGHCYSQNEPLFNPSLSSSYSNVSCSSPVCDLLEKQELNGGCSASICGYKTSYLDNDATSGFLAKEKFTLTSSDVFDGVNFGCGNHNEAKHMKEVAGILGLGPGELSFPSQTAKTFNKIFSYCLPSSASNFAGHLTFGSAGISKSVKYTPVSSESSHRLNIVGITVCDKQLEIPSTVFSTSSAVIDSGTMITRLPSIAYSALESAFKEKMSIYKITSASEILETCYDFSGLKTVTIPKIAFSFGGGTIVELDPKGILYPIKISQVCFAFARNNKDTDATIFGNVQQQTLQVVYDGAAKRIGFAPNGCT